jgi:phage gpG-like protein
MFNSNNCAFVVAPTGAAAHNVGGQTIHREFKVNINKKKKISLSEKAKIQLMEKLMFTIAVFFDERSMISQKVLGSAELNI